MKKQYRISGVSGSFRRAGMAFPPYPDHQVVSQDTFTPEEWGQLHAEPELKIVEDGTTEPEQGNDGETPPANDDTTDMGKDEEHPKVQPPKDNTPQSPWADDLGADRKDLHAQNVTTLKEQVKTLMVDAQELGLSDDVIATIKPKNKSQLVSAIVWLEDFIAQSNTNDGGDENSGDDGSGDTPTISQNNNQ